MATENVDTGSPTFRQALPWIAFVSLLFLLNYSARCALSPLLVSLELDFGIGHAQATSLLLMQGIGLSLSLGIGGFLLGVVQPRAMVVFALTAGGVCFTSMPLYATLNGLRFAFLIFGLASGLYFAASMTTLGSLVSYKDWGKAVGIHELAPNLGFILCPIIAQALLLWVSWRGVLVCWGVAMCVTALLFARFGRGGHARAMAPSLRGSLNLLRHPSLWIFMFLMAVALIGEYGIFSILQLYLVSAFGMEPDHANYLISVSRLVTPLMVVIGGWAADHIPTRRFLCFTFGLHTVGLALMSLPGFRLAMAGTLFQAVSIALSYPALFKLLAECYPVGLQPVVLSLTLPPSGLLATGLVPSLLGLAGETIGFGPGLLAVAALSGCCLPLLLAVRRFEPSRSRRTKAF